ncbi:MAG TPA: 50S ribosome-binding GTPase, partial [Pseudobdellovibrionaceae bacterium]|nr:50S ribosome-binding GTPase [Pseudobdellovibrionaceae bacterium]
LPLGSADLLPNSPSTSAVDGERERIDSLVMTLRKEIEGKFEVAPPTIAVIGLSGVGKSSAINAMFGTDLKTSATVRGTSEFESVRVRLNIKRGEAEGGIGFLRVYDAPGLGEDRDIDPKYMEMYEEHLPLCDVALWIVAGRNRALALDQQYLERLGPLLQGKVVFGVSQVDLVDPVEWNKLKNLPSDSQLSNIAKIVEDRSARLSKAIGKQVKCVPFSSANYYNLMDLYEHIVEGAPRDRRWMFDFVRSFSAADWIARAEGLTDDQRAAIVKKYGVKNCEYL